MTAPFVQTDNFDSDAHHFRVYEPVVQEDVEWLYPIAEEYIKLLTHHEAPLTMLKPVTSEAVMDLLTVQKYMRKASIPSYKKGNFNVVRSDFGELLCYMLLEKEYKTLFGVKSIFSRELRDAAGRGIDAIGIEMGDVLTLVLCEVKVSDEKPSPPRVVDYNEDCLSKQHRYHLAHLAEATKDKIWRAALRTRDEDVAELLMAAAIYLEEQELDKLRIVVCNVLIRPKSKYTKADFGSFRTQPVQYDPADIRFLIACVPDNVDVIIKEWYDVIQNIDEVSA
ncbi:hypothetical protein [Dictyobacter kobayashii]|uniref:Anti-bacteriophage protein A/HamA C-terminal domain-containing protein n=1 Tax=Dictyobacter kobayashii TaxID=2014872 RepID=A0A402AEZ4_9CHLR|nr:hypothetical protein [Dictyobacter kobayashii]GCE17656.1 hypothetical protein KDK_14560 [Dictyobacter kobayashii]